MESSRFSVVNSPSASGMHVAILGSGACAFRLVVRIAATGDTDALPLRGAGVVLCLLQEARRKMGWAWFRVIPTREVCCQRMRQVSVRSSWVPTYPSYLIPAVPRYLRRNGLR